MNKRDVVVDALEFRSPAYVPWDWGATQECGRRLNAYILEHGRTDLRRGLEGHTHGVGSTLAAMAPAGPDKVRDVYGVTWDRSVDKDIGVTIDWPIRRPEDLDRYTWPDADDERWYVDARNSLAKPRGMFTQYAIGFSLYERAWTMRGMSELLMDMVDRPEFVERLLDQITEHNLAQIRKALTMPIDAVHFGDDYGSQTGLIMGTAHWRHFIKPRLARLFAAARDAGKYVTMHSCGRVDGLFDDLVEIGLNCFNPFQPEVMDVFDLIRRYHGRLAFHGGLSTQKTLPFGSTDDVRQATQKLIDAGRAGGYLFAPAHAVPPDVPPENLVAMMETLLAQPGVAKVQ